MFSFNSFRKSKTLSLTLFYHNNWFVFIKLPGNVNWFYVLHTFIFTVNRRHVPERCGHCFDFIKNHAQTVNFDWCLEELDTCDQDPQYRFRSEQLCRGERKRERKIILKNFICQTTKKEWNLFFIITICLCANQAEIWFNLIKIFTQRKQKQNFNWCKLKYVFIYLFIKITLESSNKLSQK